MEPWLPVVIYSWGCTWNDKNHPSPLLTVIREKSKLLIFTETKSESEGQTGVGNFPFLWRNILKTRGQPHGIQRLNPVANLVSFPFIHFPFLVCLICVRVPFPIVYFHCVTLLTFPDFPVFCSLFHPSPCLTLSLPPSCIKLRTPPLPDHQM